MPTAIIISAKNNFFIIVSFIWFDVLFIVSRCKDRPKRRKIKRISPKPSGGNPYFWIISFLLRLLILLEGPGISVLGEYDLIAVERHYLEADVVEGLEAEVVFHDEGVTSLALGGVTLYEKAVAFVLEVPIYLIVSGFRVPE